MRSLRSAKQTRNARVATARVASRLRWAAGIALTVAAVAAQAIPVVAYVPPNRFIYIDTAAPGTVVAQQNLTGLPAGVSFVGIDKRPANGTVYGIGGNGQTYSINLNTGVVNSVGAIGTALDGTSFGVDFNPVPDRIRLVSDNEQNLRVNPDTGGLAATDAAINPAGNLVSAAYSNNFAGATTTTLYTIDSASDIVNIQNPPNNGTQVAVGPLGLDTSAAVGFDIVGAGTAIASLTVGGVPGLYSINLTTGGATSMGTLPVNGITDITAIDGFPAASIPTLSQYAIWALIGVLGLFAMLRLRRSA
jgi:Domain of unknown function (DUF4394)/IPTL-CTERM motif